MEQTNDRGDPVVRPRAQVDVWKAAHPGFDEHNFPDAFRDETDGSIENAAFFEAAALFSQFALFDQ